MTIVEKFSDKGIDIQGPRGEVAQNLHRRGVSVNPESVYRVGRGIRSGVRILRRVDAAEILKTVTSQKDLYYADISSAGLETRTQGRAHRKKPPFLSQGFLPGIAAVMTEDTRTIEIAFRAMRADVSMAELAGEIKEGVNNLTEPIEDYLNAYPKSSRIARAGREWDGQSVADFYRNYYQYVDHIVSASTLTPYEVEIFSRFYEARLLGGSGPSPLDRLVLETVASRGSRDALFATVRDRTGVKYDTNAHALHTNILLYGGSTSPIER